MKKTPGKKPKTELGRKAARALKWAAKDARAAARLYGTPIHVEINGKIVALKP